MLEIVKTINGVKQLVPLTTDSGQGLPLGAITAFYGTTPPNGYLICDGSEFSTTDYPALYTFLGDNHTPDLRGEFLRGAGNNSHTNQGNGGNVGEHQDATEIPLAISNVANYLEIGKNLTNTEYMWRGTNRAVSPQYSYDNVGGAVGYSTRPTNTSVNFIIKAVIGPIEDSAADQVVQNVNNSRSYSTEEVNTGKTWIDGKPIYRKVFYSATNFGGGVQTVATLPEVETMINMFSIGADNDKSYRPFYSDSSNNINNCAWYFETKTLKSIRLNAFNTTYPSWIIVEYTKVSN